ncbi:MAG: DUF4253 domain-containing protein [Corynebacterium sp.]|nr:DUF4253 domain-containing protein [Corynebacterium sp.]
MDFQPWPKQIKPYCPNPHTLDELKEMLTDWGYEYEMVKACREKDDVYEEVALRLPPRPELTKLRGHLIATFPELGFWPVTTEGYLNLYNPCLDEVEQPSITNSALTANSFDTKVIKVPADNYLLITPVKHPADIPAAIGWDAANYDCYGSYISSVLRSWEARFGAIIFHLEHGTIKLMVRDFRPLTKKELTALAWDHYHFCPDNIDQSSYDFDEYRDAIATDKVWHFWWD